jgi:hypothetical protein
MADIIAIDHDRRDGHAGFLADFNCIQRFDECRNSTFGERLKGSRLQAFFRGRWDSGPF